MKYILLYISSFIGDVTQSHSEFKKCLIPNCHTTTWKTVKHETFQTPNKTKIGFAFDPARKVYTSFIHTKII